MSISKIEKNVIKNLSFEYAKGTPKDLKAELVVGIPWLVAWSFSSDNEHENGLRLMYRHIISIFNIINVDTKGWITEVVIGMCNSKL